MNLSTKLITHGLAFKQHLQDRNSLFYLPYNQPQGALCPSEP
jgi:hypothetical protein